MAQIDDRRRRRVHKMIAESVSKKDIAKALGMSRTTVIQISKEPIPPDPKRRT